jgi:hypothetical protein
LKLPPVEGVLPIVVRPFLRRKGVPISKHVKVLERSKIKTWVPMGPEHKICCTAGASSYLSDRPTDRL